VRVVKEEVAPDKRSSEARNTCVIVLSVLSMACLASNAFAQVSTATEEQRRRAQQETEERLRNREAPRAVLPVPLPVPETPAESSELTLPLETPCFTLTQLKLDGNRVTEFGWLQTALDAYQGQCMGHQGLSIIVKRLNALLIERGFVTARINIPEQDLSTGKLTLILIPGVIRDIRFNDSSTPNPTSNPASLRWRSAFPTRPGDLLNLRDLEQGLEQLKRVPSQDADMQIAPGERPGESDIIITLKQSKAWRISATLDDSGSRPTGKLQASLSVSLDNLLGLNDLLSLTTTNDAEGGNVDRRGTHGDSLSYSVPWGYWTLHLSSSQNKYRQVIQGVNQTFISSGESAQSEIKLHRVIDRDQSSKTAMQMRLIRRSSHSFIDETEIDVQKRTTTAVEVALIHNHYMGSAQFDVTLAHKEGVPWLGGMKDAENRLSSSPTFRYNIQTLDLSLTAPFTLGDQRLRWLSAWRGQTTRMPLYAADYFAIGGRYTVRGFDGEQTLAAEQGWYWRNELELALGNSGIATYAALDHGYVSGPSATFLAGHRLTGAALGLRGGAHGFSFDVFAGQALNKPEGFTTRKPTLGFQLAYQY